MNLKFQMILRNENILIIYCYFNRDTTSNDFDILSL